MRPIDLSDVSEATEYPRLPTGGYICRITLADDYPLDGSTGKGDYLKIEYDIAEGEFKGYYAKLHKAKSFWGGSFIRSYKKTALPFFKSFTTACEKSNPSFKWSNDENALVGLLIGLVLGQEEYKAGDGTTKKRLRVAQTRSVDEIRSGNFTVPELKTLNAVKPSTTAATSNSDGGDFTEIDDDGDLPF